LSGRRSVNHQRAQCPLPDFPRNASAKLRVRICREKNKSIGVEKNPAFSIKNGLFSGKNTANRWLIVTCGSSDSPG